MNLNPNNSGQFLREHLVDAWCLVEGRYHFEWIAMKVVSAEVTWQSLQDGVPHREPDDQTWVRFRRLPFPL